MKNKVKIRYRKEFIFGKNPDVPDDDYNFLKYKLGNFTEYLTPRLYMRKGQMLESKAKAEVHSNGETRMYVTFTIYRLDRDGNKINKVKTTSSYNGSQGIIISRDKYYEEVSIDGWGFSFEKTRKQLALIMANNLKDNKHPEHYPNTI